MRTAGTYVRSAVLKYLGYLGITVDEKANDTHGEEITISTPDSKVHVMCYSYKRRACNRT